MNTAPLNTLRTECAVCGEWSPFVGRIEVVHERPYAIVHCPSCRVDFRVWQAEFASQLEARVMNDLRAALNHTDAFIEFRSGHREAPDRPHGETLIRVRADGGVRVERWRGKTQHDEWAGSTTREYATAIATALAQTSFPFFVKPARLMPGTTIEALRVTGGGHTLEGRVASTTIRNTPALVALSNHFDLLIRAASEDAIPYGHGDAPPFTPS